ncbi:hypothetical protein COO60DRAFT_1703883 [Scenedesmus sp. NREL 46B-D3]|nr:hypothetical protein COO60DRAFT_1703883 [Scenedesmus sp. NREL 46B-D3]
MHQPHMWLCAHVGPACFGNDCRFKAKWTLAALSIPLVLPLVCCCSMVPVVAVRWAIAHQCQCRSVCCATIMACACHHGMRMMPSLCAFSAGCSWHRPSTVRI